MEETSHPWQDPESKEILVDYCIVGGGISGLYSAVRLSQVEEGQEPPKICILEATQRVGGRIATVDIPGTSFYADLGAMRFLPSQPLINSVVEHYDLTTYDYDFPTDFYFVRGRRIGPQSVEEDGKPERKTRLRSVPSTADSSQSLYHSLRAGEADKEPGTLVIHAIAKALQEVSVIEPNSYDKAVLAKLADTDRLNRALDKCYDTVMEKGFLAFTPKEWRTIKLLGKYPTMAGLYLYQLGFWDIVQSQLSSEAYSLVDEGLGYQTIIGTWNAADAIPWFLADFSNLPYQSVEGGMGEIPRHLHYSFLDSMRLRRDLSPFNPAWVMFQRTRAKKIWWQEADGRVAVDADMTVANGLTISCKIKAAHCLVCVSKGAVDKIKFAAINRESVEQDLKKHSVLRGDAGAVAASYSAGRERPPLIGRVVNEYSDDLSVYTFEWLLRCVEPQPLLKMFLSFKHAWWEGAWQRAQEPNNKSAQGFKVFTNLPLRQIFYHFARSRSRTETARGDTQPVGEGRGMIMAYCDAKHASYWDALALQGRQRYASGELESILRKRERSQDLLSSVKRPDMEADLSEFGVSRHLAERAHEQIWRVHRGLVKSEDLPRAIKKTSDFSRDENGKQEEIAHSDTVLFMNWMRPPFYGGWHAWRIGVVSDDVKTVWERPWVEANIYFAGEVMSSDQGWSEGALRSVERVLMNQLKKPAPHWERRGGTRDGLEVVDVNKKAQDLGFDDVKDYVDW